MLRLDELDQQRGAVLDGIAERGEIYRVGTEDSYFVLGPQPILMCVLGLYDEEYGWPETVDSAGPIRDYIPGLRCHPFISRDGKLVAIAVTDEEYLEICRQRAQASP